MLDQNVNLQPMRNLSYLESEEPDELSQANALDAIDKFLSLEETHDYTNPFHENCTGKISENMISGPNLSTKVVKYLSKSSIVENDYLVRKMDVFDWVNPSEEEEREKEREDYIAYDVGPMTQMAAEAIQELFNLPSKPPIYPNEIEEDNNCLKRERGEIEMNENEKEFSVFRHPKKRRSNVERRSVTNTNRLPLILDNAKRKKRSPLIRRNRGKIGNFGAIKEVKYEEKDTRGKFKLRDRDEGMLSKKRFFKERRQKTSMSGIRVLFSQNLEPKIVKQQKKILSCFRVPVVASILDATHFVADQFARTKNMLEAIAMGKHVVTRDWLESCAANSCFVNEENFILRDLKKEREIGFYLPDSIKHAQKYPLLEGWRVLVTQKVRPDKELIKCLVKAAHGQLVERISRYTTEDEENLQGNFFIISCKEDCRICSPLLKMGIKAYDSELLLNGIVIQKLEFERYRLFA